MENAYIILKVGNHRVLLVNRKGESATMSHPADSNYVIFDYSGCDVVGSMTVEDGDLEPTPNDILAETRRFQLECNAKITNALLSAGCTKADAPTAENHNHSPVEFCSDAFENPVMVQCEECGELLDFSVDALDSLYADRSHINRSINMKSLGMTENGKQYTP